MSHSVESIDWSEICYHIQGVADYGTHMVYDRSVLKLKTGKLQKKTIHPVDGRICKQVIGTLYSISLCAKVNEDSMVLPVRD